MYRTVGISLSIVWLRLMTSVLAAASSSVWVAMGFASGKATCSWAWNLSQSTFWKFFRGRGGVECWMRRLTSVVTSSWSDPYIVPSKVPQRWTLLRSRGHSRGKSMVLCWLAHPRFLQVIVPGGRVVARSCLAINDSKSSASFHRACATCVPPQRG